MKSLTEIEHEFRDTVHVPDKKPAKQLFFCPVGLVGTGKTTITKPVSEAIGLVRLSSDEIRKLLKENGYSYENVKGIGFKIARDFASSGHSISFDMDCGNPEVVRFVAELKDELGAEDFWVHVTAPEEHIFNKFRNHPPSWLADNPQTMIDNYLAQKEKRLQENTHFDFEYVFDTSKADIQKQVEECVALIYAKINSF